MDVRAEGWREVRYPLVSGDAVLRLPRHMQDEDFDLLTAYLEIAKQADQARVRRRQADADRDSP